MTQKKVQRMIVIDMLRRFVAEADWELTPHQNAEELMERIEDALERAENGYAKPTKEKNP